MSTLELKELSAPAGEVIKIAAGKTLDLKSQGSVTMPTGSVLQVVQTTSTTKTEVSAILTWVDVAATATITPTSSSSKILVMHSAGGMCQTSGASQNIQLLRGSTPVCVRSRNGYSSTGSTYVPINWDMKYLDSPNTTSETTYKFQIRQSTTGNVRHNPVGGGIGVDNLASSTVILMEIQG